MSFILDALRKSEIERQRQSGPSIAELPVAREDRRLPVALLAIGLLLAVNVGVLLFFMMRDARKPAVDAPAAAPIATTAVVAAPAPAANLPAASELSAAAEVAGDDINNLPVLVAQESATLPPDAPDPTLLPDTPSGVPGGNVTYGEPPMPRADALTTLAVGLPELVVDLHIYTEDPAKRAVFINGRRYTEGATLTEGPVVEEITREGAVLTYRSRRFLLPRL